MNIKIIDIKKDNPPADVAVFYALEAIEIAEKEGLKGLVFIHGYGSHGVGGLIKKELMLALKELKSQHKIKDYIRGETFCSSHPLYSQLIKSCPELILGNTQNPNAGLTIVVL